jgi:hypothetical protein
VTTVVRCVVAFVVAFAGLLAAPAHTPASAMLTTVISACASNDAIHDQPVEHVAPRSYGRFARPDGGTPLVGYTSEVPRLLAQVDKPSTTKGSGVQESVVFLSVLPDGQVAANTAAVDAVLPTPQVSNPRLQNIVNNLYKDTAKPNRVGNGTTMDAIRREVATGTPTGGRMHLTKGQESLNGLNNWLRRNPEAPYADRLVAQSLADEL